MQRDEPITALIADHDRWTRQIVSSMLEDAGFVVNEASNGMSALRSAAEMPPQIALIGQALPEIAAADVLRTLRAHPSTRNTALVQLGAAERRLEVDGWLTLPCNPLELLATVVNALEARHARVQSRVAARAALPTLTLARVPSNITRLVAAS